MLRIRELNKYFDYYVNTSFQLVIKFGLSMPTLPPSLFRKFELSQNQRPKLPTPSVFRKPRIPSPRGPSCPPRVCFENLNFLQIKGLSCPPRAHSGNPRMPSNIDMSKTLKISDSHSQFLFAAFRPSHALDCY